ncbi:MAG: DivIVA domain-containing protein [Clostridiales bacterium]|jgi:cell division initiation protein|nr:divIVA domain protein [Clostridium sp. CAG:567]
MLTPLDIENKKFSKQMMNGYSVNEVDEFLDELTADYEKLYKETTDSKNKIADMQEEMAKYKNIESTLNNTLIMAQTAAEDVKNLAKQQADNILSEAQANAKQAVTELEQEIALKQKELEDLQKQFDVYKAKMESLLISQLELLKEVNKD